MKPIYRTITASQLMRGHVLQRWSNEQRTLLHHEVLAVDLVAGMFTRRALNGKHTGKIVTLPLEATYTVYDRTQVYELARARFMTPAPEMEMQS